MSLQLINEVWKTLRPAIETGDVDEAAEMLIQYLIDEDFSPTEIKTTFRGDSSIKEALAFYLERPEDGLFVENDVETFDDYFDDYDSIEYDNEDDY